MDARGPHVAGTAADAVATEASATITATGKHRRMAAWYYAAALEPTIIRSQLDSGAAVLDVLAGGFVRMLRSWP